MPDFLNSLLLIAIVWFVIGFFSFGELGCANLIAAVLLFLLFAMVVQNAFIWISPYLIWLALVPLVPIGLWLGKALEKRLATGNPGRKAKDPNEIPPL
jgi:hypothetical protein